ncbi:MAG: hypothetical protein IPF41_15545 [Flavobacteriales bacterium]|nr:hypothetical protein [Flavobacteriales bacterium]
MHWAVSFIVYCKPTTEAYQQWQIDTFAALKTAYDQKLSEYNRWLNQQAYLAGQYGANPAIDRQTERQIEETLHRVHHRPALRELRCLAH